MPSDGEGARLWETDMFYSHDNGYKMCLRVAGEGDDETATHLSVYLCLAKGPHDDELTWPLREEFEVKLLNQISDCEHYSKRAVYRESEDDNGLRVMSDNMLTFSTGHHTFICHEDLQQVTPTCQYLKDDNIFFQIRKL